MILWENNMLHARYSRDTSIYDPSRGNIVRIDGDGDYIVAATNPQQFALISLHDGNRWRNPSNLTWIELVGDFEKIVFIWNDIKAYLKDVNPT
jgi:Ser/Thr protein kinase RdoA (MazF antagonist)